MSGRSCFNLLGLRNTLNRPNPNGMRFVKKLMVVYTMLVANKKAGDKEFGCWLLLTMTAHCASRCPAAAVTLARACQRGSSASFDEDGTLGQIACKVQLLRNVPSDLAVFGHGEPAAWLVMPMPKQIAAPMASENNHLHNWQMQQQITELHCSAGAFR